MKSIFFLLLFIPFFSSAQKESKKGLLFKLYGDTTLGKPVKLPELKGGELYTYFEMRRRSEYGYTIRHDSIYRKIFAAYHEDSLPVIDFTSSELLLHSYCAQCLTTCRHTGLKNEHCHRNACMYSRTWFVRDKTK